MTFVTPGIGIWWSEGNVGLMAAAIAFYSMLSLVPLLAFVISVAGLFLAEAVVEDQLLTKVAEIFGQETADFLAGVIKAAFHLNSSGPILAIIGAFLVVFFASTVFNSLKLALNSIWDVTPENTPYLARQRARIQSGLGELDRRFDPADGIVRDSALRCACFLDWALFRNRLSLDGLDNLQGLLQAAKGSDLFNETAPA